VASARRPEERASPIVEALERGDWAGFWEELGVPISDADRHLMELSDPRAMAAVQFANERSSYAPDPAHVRVPTLLYYGSVDGWAPVEAAAAAFGIEPQILPGRDHSGAIRDSEVVLGLAFEFLDSAYPANVMRPRFECC
jgi:pimeloyl-ACP methyl ester carboxylesterase